MPPGLTSIQKSILQFIEDQLDKNGFFPSQAEIGLHFGYKSPNATRQNLKLIEKKGYIELVPGVARGMRLLRRIGPSPDNSVPLVGTIAAGKPILAEENVEDHINLPRSLFPNTNDRFALRVEGDSMTGAGIFDGDIAVIRKQTTAQEGEIAAIRLDDEATLKRILFRNQSLVLKAENPAFEDIEICESSVLNPIIEGVLEGIIRTTAQRGNNW